MPQYRLKQKWWLQLQKRNRNINHLQVNGCESLLVLVTILFSLSFSAVEGTNEFCKTLCMVEASKAVMVSGLDRFVMVFNRMLVDRKNFIRINCSTNKVLLTKYAGLSENGAGLAKDIFSGKHPISAICDRYENFLVHTEICGREKCILFSTIE